MADVAILDHCGFSVPDVRAGARFFEEVLGARSGHWNALTTDDLGSAPHTGINLGDFFFVLFPHGDRVAEPARPRGIDGSRHGYVVPQERFPDVVARLREYNVPMEGPISHPEHGPLGESVYFTDPGGNYHEICWRRDREQMRGREGLVDGSVK